MKKRRAPQKFYRYTMLDVLQASPTEPMSAEKRRYQLLRMNSGLAAMEKAEAPTTDDWRVCSDAVNLMETFVAMGVCEDASGLIDDAVKALADAGKRYKQGNALRLDALGMQAVRAVLEDYAAVLDVLPARTVIAAHRNTERRIQEILAGKRKPHDVELADNVVDL
ncbi:MAG: hypothetical protein RLZZ481_838 [Pseudomonadota bacterium]